MSKSTNMVGSSYRTRYSASDDSMATQTASESLHHNSEYGDADDRHEFEWKNRNIILALNRPIPLQQG